MAMGESQDVVAKAAFYGVMACWMVFLVTFLLRKRPPKGAAVTRRNWTAMIGIGVQGLGYFLVWFRPWARAVFSPIVPLSRWAEISVAVLTVAIAAGSVWLVNAAVRRLGKQWAVAARLVEGHKLITDGPYGLVRNPIYLGIYGMLIATGLAIARWETLLVGMVLFAVGTWIRVRSEERLLREGFGSEFDEYARRVPALIPGIW